MSDTCLPYGPQAELDQTIERSTPLRHYRPTQHLTHRSWDFCYFSDGRFLRGLANRVEPEQHYTSRTGWLRAAVLGANDGIVSTASLVMGVAAAQADTSQIMVAGVAGLVAGAMSMAAGEYVSVSSQADAERADLERERRELKHHPQREHDELAGIYVDRGLDATLARQVAEQLMAHDALAAHARDELGLSKEQAARPVQAAVASAATFSLGASVPLLIAFLSPPSLLGWFVAVGSSACLAGLGALAARAGGAPIIVGAGRVLLWGAVAMAATSFVGRLVGPAI